MLHKLFHTPLVSVVQGRTLKKGTLASAGLLERPGNTSFAPISLFWLKVQFFSLTTLLDSYTIIFTCANRDEVLS